MLPTSFLATTLVGFLANTAIIPTNFFDKIGFDLDRIGCARQTSLIEETARVAYAKQGMRVNIAVWNMHVPEQHHFEGILETGLQPMGKGGGFRVVVFRGEGWLQNKGGKEDGDWKFSGDYVVEGLGDVVKFRSLGGEEDVWALDMGMDMGMGMGSGLFVGE
jgi:hypothetical protein